jgi:uridine phosphorylase
MTNSELILNPDGSIFHLHLFPEDIADTIFLLGDPNRVELMSANFGSIRVKKANREFITHTGTYNGKEISVISTGIGTDNIDIVVNELDALANIDLATNTPKKEFRKLNLIRIGTSGALQDFLEPGVRVISKTAIGFDGLLNFYEGVENISDHLAESAFLMHTNWNGRLTVPYFVNSSDELFNKFSSKLKDSHYGMNISAPGFYAPQGRELRLKIVDQDINSKLSSFEYCDLKITNYEMECSAIYGLAALMGHEALTICQIIANRIIKKADANYKENMKILLKEALDIVSE